MMLRKFHSLGNSSGVHPTTRSPHSTFDSADADNAMCVAVDDRFRGLSSDTSVPCPANASTHFVLFRLSSEDDQRIAC